MDKRIKFSIRQKVSAARSVITGRESILSVSWKLGAGPTTVRRWVRHYQADGISGLKLRQGSYQGTFKLRVVRYMLNNHLSLLETATFFGIPQDDTVLRWLNMYESYGAAYLLNERRGRKKSLMAKKPKKSNKKIAASESIDDRLAALQAENEYLRTENAFLKKLDALIQEENAAKLQSKRQKSSGN